MNKETIIVCILSSTLAATIVTSIKELVIWKLNRKAKLEDDGNAQEDTNEELKRILNDHQECLEKVAKSIEDLEKKLSLSLENDKIILRDKIKYLILKYAELGEITLDEKQAINHMWHIYHFDLNGNGDLDDFMEILEEIKVVNHHTIPRGGLYT